MIRRALALSLLALVPACGAAPPSPALARSPPVAEAAALGPPRYLVVDPTWIERTGEGLDRVLVNGRRAELRGAEIAALGPAEPEIDGGARAPAWSPGGAARYVFWRGKQLWSSESFLGALRPLGALPANPLGSFAWLDGTGIALVGGARVAPASGEPPRRTGVPALLRGIAADARRAVAFTALGHALLTLDGGASYRDVSADSSAAPRPSRCAATPSPR